MKKLIFILACLLLLGCSEEKAPQKQESAVAEETEITIVTEEPVEAEPVDESPVDETPIAQPAPRSEPEPETIIEVDEPAQTEPDKKTPNEPSLPPAPIRLALLASGTLYFYNGEFLEQPNANAKFCGTRCFTDASIDIVYDSSADTETIIQHAIEYDFVLDNWQIIAIDPVTAFSLGGQAKDYTDIYYQDVPIGHWSFNQWKTTGLIKTLSGAYFAIDVNGNPHPISETIISINHAKDLLIHNFDGLGRTATIETDQSYSVSWSTNYFNSAKQWLAENGIWYSWNGYEFDTDLTENANAMWSWNSPPYPITTEEAPVIISAGVVNLQYWIECNTGWLFTYDSIIDEIQPAYRLYPGDGYRLTGLARKDTLKPVIIDGILYFSNSGIYALNLESGIVTLFFAGDGEIYEWE